MTSHRYQKLTGFIEAELAAGSFPGAAVMVTRQGERLFERCWGTWCSATECANPLDAGVSHMLYSFSKGISATVIVLAHQQKLIDYDAPIHAYIREYRGAWKDVTTIRHLLTHSAGIPQCPLGGVYTPEAWRAGVALCCAAPVDWAPGSKTQYHGTSGLFLAAEAVRRTLNMAPWEDICRELLFAPLNAGSLTFQIPATPCVALTPQPKELPWPIGQEHFQVLGHPGAGCFGRIEDITKVIELHLNRGVWNGQVLIREEEVAEMHRIQYEDRIVCADRTGSPRVHEPWGLGWLIKRDLKDHWFGFGQATCPQTFGHAGIDTVIGVGDPGRRLAVAFLTTGSPNPSGTSASRLRNTVTDLVVEAVG